jgi:hypothetical protein
VATDRRPAPPPLEANDELVTGIITAGWAVALLVVFLLRGDLPAGMRWWVWTCLAGLVMGIFGLWYVPRHKRGQTRAAQGEGQGQRPGDGGPGDGGSGGTAG